MRVAVVVFSFRVFVNVRRVGTVNQVKQAHSDKETFSFLFACVYSTCVALHTFHVYCTILLLITEPGSDIIL